jgi:dolichol-phosphate mannosyltransferase
MISVILPTKEEPGIQKIVDEINEVLDNMKHEILVVDKSVVLPKVKGAIVVRQVGDGLGSAVLQGMKHAKGKVFVVMDADFSHDPKDIRRLLNHIENYDIVLGSRYVKGGRNEDNLFNLFVSKASCFFAARFLGINVKDCMSGFIAMKREVPESMKLNPIGYKINMEILHKARKKGFSHAEVPITFKPRKVGKSKRGFIGIKELLRGGKYILRLKFGS